MKITPSGRLGRNKLEIIKTSINMKAVKVFKPLQVSLFTNGPHVAFMQRIYDELNSLIERAEKLHVSDELMAEFKSCIY